MLPNRIAVYLTALAAIAAGLAPVVADFDWESTVGVVAGLAAILGVVNRWLIGWQQYEALSMLPPDSDASLGDAPLSGEPIEPDPAT